MGLSVASRCGAFIVARTILAPCGAALVLALAACATGSPAGKDKQGSLASLDAEMRDWERERPRVVVDSVPADHVQPSDTFQASGIDIDAVDVPLSGLLFTLARDADLEFVLLDPLDDAVTVRLSNASLDSVLKALAGQVAFRYQLDGKRLQISNADPYTQSYAIDYLNLDRQTESRVGLATQVGTINMANGGGSGIANSSETLVINAAKHHFWASLEADLHTLLGDDGTGDVVPRWTTNRDSGLLTVFASVQSHRRLERYLKRLHDSSRRQVLIEATVVEVALSDAFQAGIDWQLIASNLSGVNVSQLLTGAPTVTAASAARLSAPGGLVSLVQQNDYGDVQATLSLLEQFGDVRILSRPRIIALNNQSSVLKVVDNRVYFTLNVERRRTEESDEFITESQIHTVPVGLVMNVTPFIDSEDAVMLNVRPTLSRILGFVNDPNPALALADVRNGVPEIQVREMESMLRVSSGESAIIGGLMQETERDTRSRIPGLGHLPLLGKLFSSRSTERTQTELLVVLRPTIMPEAGIAPQPSVAANHLSAFDRTLSSPGPHGRQLLR